MSLRIKREKAVASIDHPAVVTIELPPAAAMADGAVELTVRTLKLDPKRKFIVTASKVSDGVVEQVGELAFFPPAQPGKNYKFRVDAPRQGASTAPEAVKLTVALVPLAADQSPSKAAVEVVSARLLKTKQE